MVMSEKAERLDIRLGEEEKKRLAELAKQRGVSMTDLVKTWIMRGDVVHVLAEQLQDIMNDFAKWHVLEHRSTNIGHLCNDLRGRMEGIEDQMRRVIIYEWIGFFNRSYQLIRNDVVYLRNRLNKFVKQREPKDREVLFKLTIEFSQIVTSYHNIFLQGFLDILQNMDEKTKRRAGETYNDEFRTRYNEIASKYEDFLKRTQRELGGGLESAMPRAREFRAKE